MADRRRGSVPKRSSYQDIAESLRAQIREGKVPPGHYLPTERALQESFEASRSTVRRALSALISTGYGTNVPSKGVVALQPEAVPKTKTIALIDSTTAVLNILFARMSDALRAKGYHLVHLGSMDKTIEESLQYAVDHEFAGAFVWPYRGFPDTAQVAKLGEQIPIVALDHALRGYRSDLATFDYFDAAYRATSHLIESGRRRIGITGMMDMLDISHDRLSGYMKALFDHGLKPFVRDYVFLHTSGAEEPDLLPLRRRLSDEDRPDAFLVMQDEFCPRVIETALELGLAVPGDIALCTIGDDVGVDVDGLGLSAVALDWEGLAESAISMMLRRIRDPKRAPELVRGKHMLVVRGLCSAAANQWTRNPERYSGFTGEVPYPKTKFQYRSSLLAGEPALSSSQHSHRRSM